MAQPDVCSRGVSGRVAPWPMTSFSVLGSTSPRVQSGLMAEIEGQVKVLPILYRPCEIPLSLRRKAWADFTSSPEEGLSSLLRSL